MAFNDTMTAYPRAGRPETRRLDPTVPLLALACALLHFIVHHGSYPEHDTYYVFQTFKTVYESMMAGGGLPTWLSEVQYGAPAHVYLFPSLTPWQYLAALFGGFIGWPDGVLPLFHLSVALEMATFLIGGGLLVGHLTERRAAAALFVIMAAATAVTHWQVWFNLRIVTLLPLIAYFLSRFGEERRPLWFLSATLAAMIWLVGNVFYFLPIALLLLALLAVLLAGGTLRQPLMIRWEECARPGTAAVLVVNIAFAVCLICVASHVFDDVALHSPSRGADGATDPLTFLTYGGGIDLRKFTELLLALPHNPDSVLYFGMVPLALALYAPMSGAWPKARPFALIGLLFLALTLPGLLPVARFLYDLPGMHYFRHIGLMAGVARVCFLIVAAISCDALLAAARRGEGDSIGAAARLSALLAAAAVILAMAVGWDHTIYPPSQMFPDYPAAFGPVSQVTAIPVAAALLFALALWANLPGRTGGPDLGRAVVVLALLEGGGFANFAYWSTESNNPPVIASAFRAVAPVHHAWRHAAIADEDAPLIAFYGDYYPLEAMLSRARCVETGRRDARAKGVADLIDARGGVPRRPMEAPQPRGDDVALSRVLACERPIARLTNQIVLTPDVAATRRFIAGDPAFGALAGLTCPPAADDCRALSPWRLVDEPVAVTGSAADRFIAEVDVDQPGGGWLIVTDAWTAHWRATIDGVSTPVRRADLGFKAVRVPTGRHLVEFVHAPPPALVYGYLGLLWMSLVMVPVGVLGLLRATRVVDERSRSQRRRELLNALYD